MWSDPALAAGALERWMAGWPPGSVAMLSRVDSRPGSGEPTEPDPTPPSPRDRIVRFWVAGGERWRIELGTGGADGTFVSDHGQWLHWTGSTAMSGESPSHQPPPGLPGEVHAMLDPDELLSEVEVTPTGRVVIAGRDASGLTATPRDPDHILWPGAQELGLALDDQIRILLRLELLFEGKAFHRLEFVELELDPELPDDLFGLDLPPGVPVLRTPPPGELGRGRRPPRREGWPRVGWRGIQLRWKK